MAIATSQQITRYYDLYRDTEITFTKDIIRTLSMDPRQIFIKCAGSQWPCIINSTSFQLARIIIGTKGGAFQQIAQHNPPPINLRFCFFAGESQLLSFFIASKVTNITPYMNSKDLAVVTLTYTQRPPDDLIEMVGHLLDANTNSIRRKEERILINEDSRRRLSIPHEETIVIVQNVPRHCILRDLSFGGAKIILLGLAQFLTGKDIVLRIEFDEPHEVISLQGKIIAAEQIQGRKDIISVNIQYNDATVPLSYKIHINSFLTSTRKKILDTEFSASGEPVSAETQAATPTATPVAKPASDTSPDAKSTEEKPADGKAEEAKPTAEGTEAKPEQEKPAAGATAENTATPDTAKQAADTATPEAKAPAPDAKPATK
jgi:hypothetical protein